MPRSVEHDRRRALHRLGARADNVEATVAQEQSRATRQSFRPGSIQDFHLDPHPLGRAGVVGNVNLRAPTIVERANSKPRDGAENDYREDPAAVVPPRWF